MIKTRGSFLVCLECCSDKNWYVLLITDGACHYMKKNNLNWLDMKQVTKGAQWTPKPVQGAPSKGP